MGPPAWIWQAHAAPVTTPLQPNRGRAQPAGSQVLAGRHSTSFPCPLWLALELFGCLLAAILISTIRYEARYLYLGTCVFRILLLCKYVVVNPACADAFGRLRLRNDGLTLFNKKLTRQPFRVFAGSTASTNARHANSSTTLAAPKNLIQWHIKNDVATSTAFVYGIFCRRSDWLMKVC